FPSDLEDQRVHAEELFDGPGDQVGVVDDGLPVGVVAGQVGVDVAEGAAGGVQPGEHQRQADGEDVLFGDGGAVDAGFQEPGDHVFLGVARVGAAFPDGLGEVVDDVLPGFRDFGRVFPKEPGEDRLRPGQEELAVADGEPEQG